MTERRRFGWALTSARVIAGAAAAVAVVVAVVLAIAFPWPTVSTEPVRVEATPAPSDTVLACDGPLLVLGRVVEQAGQLELAAAQSVVAGPDTADATERALTGPVPDAGPLSFTATPDGSAPAPFAAAGSASVDAADLRGFAASACRPPLLESWIVGGATTTGSNDLVILTNPGVVAATVQVTVYGAAGAQSAPGGVDRVVPARSQIVVPLAGLLRDEASPVVHVTAAGAPVSVALQSSLTRTLLPGGVDQVSPLAAAADRQVIPGVVVSAPAADEGAEARTLVRLLAPAGDGEARVSVRDDTGRAVGETATVPLAAGTPIELELPGLAAGTYSVGVEADSPVVAGAWSTTGFGEGSDYAWFAAAPEVDLPTVVAVPRGAAPTMSFVNDRAADATVVLTSPDGSTQDVEVPATGAVEVELSESGVYALDPSAPVRAGVSFAGAGALAGYPVWGADAAAPPIVVFP
ncbi:large extracellular alpha-helical protein [Microbacterium sp. dk485]|uniref:DUF5719 family protein n=1 Tax=Microbacterium sp. dk485 TaxID=2560021 RepID=UPI001073CB2C|nr:DUF5719 family protein [Microbacterium sp. dk485]TFV83763.1 large extracellular alpha-helical protein [Microbacterium sp. dk485]